MIGWPFEKLLPVGSAAPDFETVTDTGKTVRLADLRGRHVVLVFYPGDDTPGCTRQLCEFRDNWSVLQGKGIEVFGVNPAGAKKHQHFPFPLLIDQGQKVAALYHANGLWIKRTVYLIGPDGVIRFAQRGMPKPSVVLAAAAP